MLVLGRRRDETICIGDPRDPGGPPLATVTIVNAIGVVKLGVQAAKDVPVHRQEVYDKIRQAEHAPAA